MMSEEMLKSYLNTLRLDLNFFRDSIREVSQDIIKEGYSRYPVFVAHQSEVRLGEMILDREELGTNFTIQASTLEELLERKVVIEKNKEKFIKAYKDPEKFCCIFLVTEHGAQFVFVPFENQPAEGSSESE